MDNYQWIDELIQEQAFDALSEEQQSRVLEVLDSREAYDRLHELAVLARKEGNRSVRPANKRHLVQQMKKKHRSLTYKAFHFQLPAYQGVLGMMVAALMSWLFVPAPDAVRQIVYLPSEVVRDTIEIQLPSDTVVIEKVVKEKVYITLQETTPIEVIDSIELPSKSLAEEIALKELLVRGD